MRALVADKMFVREITNGARRSAFALRKMMSGQFRQAVACKGRAQSVLKCWENALSLPPISVTV